MILFILLSIILNNNFNVDNNNSHSRSRSPEDRRSETFRFLQLPNSSSGQKKSPARKNSDNFILETIKNAFFKKNYGLFFLNITKQIKEHLQNIQKPTENDVQNALASVLNENFKNHANNIGTEVYCGNSEKNKLCRADLIIELKEKNSEGNLLLIFECKNDSSEEFSSQKLDSLANDALLQIKNNRYWENLRSDFSKFHKNILLFGFASTRHGFCMKIEKNINDSKEIFTNIFSKKTLNLERCLSPRNLDPFKNSPDFNLSRKSSSEKKPLSLNSFSCSGAPIKILFPVYKNEKIENEEDKENKDAQNTNL